MHIFLTILAIVAIVLVVVMVVLYFLGKKMQKKQDESQAQMQAASQTATILVIDKKRMKLKSPDFSLKIPCIFPFKFLSHCNSVAYFFV